MGYGENYGMRVTLLFLVFVLRDLCVCVCVRRTAMYICDGHAGWFV